MSLKDKASKINFATLITQHAAVPETRQPKTAPGAMMAFANDSRSDLLREVDELRGQVHRVTEIEARLNEAVSDLQGWEGAKPTRLVDPATVGRSRYANRHESSFLGADFEQLRREIMEAGGNVQPIKVRPSLNAGDGIEYEVVFGHRRLEACRQLGLPVLAVVDNLDDRALFVEMDRENRERADLSPWEQGVMYARALDQGLFASNRQLATALNIDLSNLGKSLALARLPADIVSAFATPLDIQLRWAPMLNKALEEDAAGVTERARSMAEQRGARGPAGVLGFLIAPTTAESIRQHPTQTFEVAGKKVATLTFDVAGRAALRFSVALSADQRARLKKLADEFVQSL
ncbi:ParB/RepB/Spo0J family partition protein [Polaromonas sp.]|uniref:ParB/RepB/Spo0J family partition protein n=1 Tax=Polaromonas sp. TaxID=1869339 RepID=UPI00352A7D69